MIDNYESMPFQTFKRLLKACEEATDDTQRTVSVLAILTGKTEDEILNLPIAEYGRLAQIARFILGNTVPKLDQSIIDAFLRLFTRGQPIHCYQDA